MKKILALLLAVLLILAMVIPAFAVTPELDVPAMPEIPDISDDVHIELPDGIFDDYIPDLDIDVDVELPEMPWIHDYFKSWHERWLHGIRWR